MEDEEYDVVVVPVAVAVEFWIKPTVDPPISSIAIFNFVL